MHGKRHSHLPYILADLGLVLFVICFFWGYVLPADVRQFHMDFMRISVIGWTGFNVLTFVLGAVQWTVWGLLIGWKAGWMAAYLDRKCPKCKAPEKPEAPAMPQ